MHKITKIFIKNPKSAGRAKDDGWKTIDDSKYYFGEYARAYTGLHEINGKKYYFNKKTAVLEWKNRKYQNPKGYYQIQESITLTGGDYTLSIGYEGLETRYVIRYLGIGSGIGMGGAYYSSNVAEHVVIGSVQACFIQQPKEGRYHYLLQLFGYSYSCGDLSR